MINGINNNSMNQNTSVDNWISWMIGMAGGGLHYTLMANPGHLVWTDMIQPLMTATACGFAGMFGKHLFTKFIKRKKR